jgi:hypothetical protein
MPSYLHALVPLQVRNLFVFLAVIAANIDSPTICAARSFDAPAARHGNDSVALVRNEGEPKSSTYKALKGSYAGTTFTLPIDRDSTPGMAYYPEAVEYGESSRYVWICSYYRYFSGITRIDLATKEAVFAAHGIRPQVSPDRRRVAYGVDGVYGLFYAVAVNDHVVYPRVRHSNTMIYRACAAVEEAFADRPQMNFFSGFSWVDNSTVVFVHSENGRAAALEENPPIKTYYLVKVTGVGEEMSTDTIAVSRTPVTGAHRRYLESLEHPHSCDAGKLLADLDSLSTYSEKNLQPDIFSHPEWPLLPNGEGGASSWLSPDNKHLLEAKLEHYYTDSHAGVGISLNQQPVVTIRKPDEDQREMASEHVTIGPTSRLLTEPRWLSNTKAEMVMQSKWVGEALLGDDTQTKYWLITVDAEGQTSGPAVAKKELSRAEANRKAWSTRDGSNDEVTD